jgi:ATP-dependent DNA helicase RecQ
MILEKPVVVVSPLLSLLRDQHQKLSKRSIPCVRLDGTVRGSERREALACIRRGGPLLVMTTPETLDRDELREVLRETGVGLAAVDEAHCISEWGHDFRPSYQRIGTRLAELGGPALLALTATATPRVRTAITESLRMREPSIVASSPHRANLAFEVVACDGDERPRALVRLIRRLRRPGIVYCATRREVDGLFMIMQRLSVPAFRYHGGMTDAEREEQQGSFMRHGRRPVMIATSAFGLGIDKADIRYVLHFQSPASLEQYVQEAGRSGRDGKKANCVLLFDRGDRAIHEALLARSRIRPDQLYRLGKAAAAWAAEGRQPTVEALAVSANLGPRITSALLVQLEEVGIVHREDGQVVFDVAAEIVEERSRTARSFPPRVVSPRRHLGPTAGQSQ